MVFASLFLCRQLCWDGFQSACSTSSTTQRVRRDKDQLVPPNLWPVHTMHLSSLVGFHYVLWWASSMHFVCQTAKDNDPAQLRCCHPFTFPLHREGSYGLSTPQEQLRVDRWGEGAVVVKCKAQCNYFWLAFPLLQTMVVDAQHIHWYKFLQGKCTSSIFVSCNFILELLFLLLI